MQENIYSVSEVLGILNSTTRRLGLLTVQGEISGFKKAPSGHAYFSLKDTAGSVINAVLFQQYSTYLSFAPQNGREVLCRGKLSVYASQGRLQLIVEDMEEMGAGYLAIAFHKLKERLEEEGLFDDRFKQPLPPFPRRIALITSPVGAAFHDLKNVLQRRSPSVSLLFAPCQVQGAGAARSIAKTIEAVNRQPDVELIILGRGGGSIEDLWPFNEEIVARAIFASSIPILTGIGHQSDVFISDFVADDYAPTPSAAAELAVHNEAALLQRIDELRRQMLLATQRLLREKTLELASLQTRLIPPQLQIERLKGQIKEKQALLHNTITQKVTSLEGKAKKLQKRIESQAPSQTITTYQQRQAILQDRLRFALSKRFDEYQHRLASFAQRLSDLSPLTVLERGYSLVYKDDKQLVKDARQVEVGEQINIQLHHGSIDAKIIKKQ